MWASLGDHFQRHGEESCSQYHLSKCVDKRILADLKAQGSLGGADEKRIAHLELTGQEGAGAWLHALPSPDIGNYMEPLLVRTSILRWLRAPIFAILGSGSRGTSSNF